VEVTLTQKPVYIARKNGKPDKVWDIEFIDDAQLNEMAYEVGTELDWWQVLNA